MSKQVFINYNLPVMILHEGSHFVAYTPALDLSVQGSTKAEVQKRFTDAVQIFFEELNELGTMDQVLEDLGWQRQPSNAWLPPQIVDNSPSEIGVRVPSFA